MKFLKEHLSEDLFAQLQEALKDNKDVKLANLSSGDYVAKAKFDTKLDEISTLKEQLEGRNNDVTALQEQLKGVEGVDDLKGKLSELQTKYDGDMASHQEKIVLANASLKVMEMGAKNAASVLAHVDMSKVKLGEDDTLQGLSEQVTPLQESMDFLFGEPKKVYKSTPPSPPPPPDDNRSDWDKKFKDAKDISPVEAIKVKQAAFAEGIILN
jgi:hypothetical protein